jgi:uncharacterized protein (TIGR03435 family)
MPGLARSPAGHLHASGRIKVDRVLVDRSGLSGAFDFTLEWTPDPVTREVVPPIQAAAGGPCLPYVSLSNAVNLAAALEQQLGLRLVPAFATEPAAIIDEIEPPTLD